MNATTSDAGDYIHVESGGELNVINGSTITTDPITPAQSPDPYEFRIDGTALINNSIVEKMDDLSGESDGIQIYSSDVTITNSTVRLSEGNGLYIYNAQPTIKHCDIIDNSHHGVYIESTDNCIFENNNVSSNDYGGIYLDNSDYNTIANSSIEANGGSDYIWRGIKMGYGIILEYSDNTIIINNSVSNTIRALLPRGYCMGIVSYHSSNSNMENNTINSNLYGVGILCDRYSTSNLINNNTINNNGGGMEIRSYSTNNIISNNNVSSSWSWHGFGILVSSSDNIIINNIASFNYRYGIYVGKGQDISIKDNYCFNNGYHGINVLWPTSDVKIENNTLYSNTLNGIYMDNSGSSKYIIANNSIYSNGNNGIYLSSSHNNTITTNNIYSNTFYGIRLSSSVDNKVGMNDISFNTDGINLTSSSNRNLITSNDLVNNTNYGLYTASSNNNEIIDNTIQNSSYGIHLISANYNIVYHNNLNNTQNAKDTGTNNLWDNGLEGNWWSDMGDYTDTDGNGICDSIYSGTSFTDYRPLANEDNDRVLVDDPWFWFIQSGVNFAEPGWTVYATPSTYLENVTINKTLTVLGEDRDTTIIDARSEEHVVLVDSTSYVNVSGFTVKNGTFGFHLNNSNYCIVGNNSISYNNLGINITQSLDIIIEYNTVSNNNRAVISDNSSIIMRYNDISYNTEGTIAISYSNVIINNNTITHNSGSGVLKGAYSNGTINNNTISYNYCGIYLHNSRALMRQFIGIISIIIRYLI
jgi:parallel beta-helix repeat protein